MLHDVHYVEKSPLQILAREIFQIWNIMGNIEEKPKLAKIAMCNMSVL